MNIYPKVSSYFEGLDKLEEYVKKYQGIELQFFDENGPIAPFDIATPIEKLMERIPEIKEITIHPPLIDYDIELVLFKDYRIIEEQFKIIVELSKKYNIRINLLYHTMYNFKKHSVLTLDKIKELIKILEGENAYLLLENIFMFPEKECTVFQIAKEVDSPNLKVCFDICHLYCRASINKSNVEDYAKTYLDKELCQKYIHQVHFSYTVNNDGYIDRKTHGRVHKSKEAMLYDLELLEKYNMRNCNYITEVSEDDYDTRVDQLKEIKWLEEIENN